MAIEPRQSVVSTFENGLVMDFSPEKAGDKCLSNALNATFLTYNGNEMSLQNDMGNARVESAYLPDGYIPIGTCEFGDIIYIVSYNPIDNKSQIGCFPSPERNISNQEISTLVQSIDSTEFVTNKNSSESPSGIVSSNAIKKIVYSKNINTGDKFIISWGSSGVQNFSTISNYGNTNNSTNNVNEYWPKLVKMHVVSIENSGKITYLDDSVKWYTDTNNQPFIISSADLTNDTTTSNLDTYRSALTCQYSVFQSKIPGKLALLFELEAINGFNCGHKIIKKQEGDSTVYDIYLSASWETENYNVNPCGMLITSSIFHNMEDTQNSQLLDLSGINSEEDKYSITRMVEFSRLYKPEEVKDYTSYEDFLKSSYYVSENLEKYTRAGVGGVQTIATSALRVYFYDAFYGKSFPKYKDNQGYYVLNPIKFEKGDDNNYYYTTQIDGYDLNCPEVLIPDDIVVNYYKKSVLKKLTTVQKMDILENAEQQSHSIEYTVCPCMPYGVLSSLAVTNFIDFDKINTGEVKLTTWKYYVNSTSITLQFGVTSYLNDEENEVIDKIIIEFYDNQGICATYELTEQESYDGVFTEYITLDKRSTNTRISTFKSTDSRDLITPIFHKGGIEALSNIAGSTSMSEYFTEYGEDYTFLDKIDSTTLNNLAKDPNKKAYLSDAGILYYGRPYGCRIKIYKGVQNELGSVDSSGYEQPIIYDRWLWTSGIFNDQYTSVKDFKNCTFNEGLDYLAELDGSRIDLKTLQLSQKAVNYSSVEDTFRAKVEYINNSEIKFRGISQLSESYGSTISLNTEVFNQIAVTAALDTPTVTLPESFTTEYEDSSNGDKSELYPITNTQDYISNIQSLPENLYNAYISGATDPVKVYDLYEKRSTLVDSYELTMQDVVSGDEVTYTYLDSNGESKTLTTNTSCTISASNWQSSNTCITFKLSGIKFTKVMATKIEPRNIALTAKPAIGWASDLAYYNLQCDSNKLAYHSKLPFIAIRELGGEDGEWGYGQASYTSLRGTLWNPSMTADGDNLTLDIKNTDHFGKITNMLQMYQLTPVVLAEGYYEDDSDGNSPNTWEASVDVSSMTSKMQVHNVSYNIIEESLQNWEKGAEVTGKALNQSNADRRINELGNAGRHLSNFPVVLAIKDNNDQSIRIGGDLKFYFNYNSGNNENGVDTIGIQQQFPWTGTGIADDNNPEYLAINNFATLLTSWFSQLYILENKSTQINVPIDVASVQQYSETWDSYIVVSQKLTKFTNTNDLDYESSTSRAINLFPENSYSEGTKGISLFWYVATIVNSMYNLNKGNVSEDWENITAEAIQEKAANVEEALDFKNINPVFSSSARAVKFSYSTPYSAQELRDTLPNTTNSVLLRTASDLKSVTEGTDAYSLVGVAASDNSKLYYYNSESQALDQYTGQSLPFYTRFDTSSGAVIPQDYIGMLPINGNSGITNCMYANGGKIQFRNLSQLQGFDYYIDVPETGGFDGHRISGLTAFSIFDLANPFT